MNDLIKALQIFAKYMDGVYSPTHCSHDELCVMCSPDLVSDEDKEELDRLGFFASEDYDVFKSYRFGSA